MWKSSLRQLSRPVGKVMPLGPALHHITSPSRKKNRGRCDGCNTYRPPQEVVYGWKQQRVANKSCRLGAEPSYGLNALDIHGFPTNQVAMCYG